MSGGVPLGCWPFVGINAASTGSLAINEYLLRYIPIQCTQASRAGCLNVPGSGVSLS